MVPRDGFEVLKNMVVCSLKTGHNGLSQLVVQLLGAGQNNKLSTVGTSLAAFEKPEIQCCYAPAVIYNYENYSVPGKRCYFIDWKELFTD